MTIQGSWARLRVRHKVWTILIAVFVPVVAALALHATLINELLALQQEHHQAVTARQQILILRRLAVDIEDAFRGYLLTGQERFLAPLREAEPRLQSTSERALAVAPEPDMRERIRSADERLTELLESKHALIRQVEAGGRNEVLQYVESGQGLVLSDAVRADLRLIEDQIEAVLRSYDSREARLARRAFWGLLLALAGGVGLGLLGSRWLTRSITEPIGALQESVGRLGQGGEPGQVAVRSEDEIGQLARAFEAMADRIRRQIAELEALNETGHEINTIGPDGLDGVLRRITDRAAQLLRADLCLVMLRHEQMACWIVEAASGDWNERLHKSVMLWEEFPVSVRAFETGGLAVGEDLRSDQRPLVQRRNVFGQSMLAVPLQSQGRPFGVLVLLLDRKVPREYWNLRLAKGLADEAAVAIANARLYEVAHRKEQRLEARLKQLEYLAETLAHDLKGPGERMEGLARMVREEYGHLDGRGKRWLELIEENGRELTARVENLLRVARVGGRAEAIEAVEPGPVIDEVLKSQAGPLVDAQARVVVEGPFPLVACHRAYFRQILDNLVSNAIKFGEGVPDLQITVKAEHRDRMAVFSVSDNGPGIPAQHRERIFEPFVRLRPDRARGSGIGLAIVKRIVELYGGTVWAEENRPRGTTIRFTVPLLGDLTGDRSQVGAR